MSWTSKAQWRCPETPEHHESMVYVARLTDQNGTQLVKVGMTKCLPRRLHGMRSDDARFRYDVALAACAPGDGALESALKRGIKASGYVPVRGFEYFAAEALESALRTLHVASLDYSLASAALLKAHAA